MKARNIDFTGLPHQVHFWQTDIPGQHTALVGGYGTGKTWSLAVKMLLMALKYQGETGMVLSPIYRMIRDPFIKTFKTVVDYYLPELNYEVGGTINPVLIFPDLKVDVLLRSAERPDTLKGVNLSWALIDEPGLISKEAYEVTSTRIRKGTAKQLFLAGTPEGMNWFCELFDNPQPGYQTIRAKSWHPDQSDYAKNTLLKIYKGQPQKIRSYVHGEFVPLFEGLVYPAFNRKDHVTSLELDPSQPLIISCDFNVNPLSFIVIQHAKGMLKVLDALSIDGTTWDACDDFLSRYPASQMLPKTLTVYGDASAQHRDTRTHHTDYTIIRDVLNQSGYHVRLKIPRSNPSVVDRVNSLNALLAANRISIDYKAESLLDSFEKTTWKPGLRIIDKPGGETWTHSTDALGYHTVFEYPVTNRAPQVYHPNPLKVTQHEAYYQKSQGISYG